jgi:hypothetical protein
MKSNRGAPELVDALHPQHKRYLLMGYENLAPSVYLSAKASKVTIPQKPSATTYEDMLKLSSCFYAIEDTDHYYIGT